MEDITDLIEGLSKTPKIIKNLIDSIPNDILKKRRIPNKWTIHKHLSHLFQAEIMIEHRFREFQLKVEPKFSKYSPELNENYDDWKEVDIYEQYNLFKKNRENTVTIVRSFNGLLWSRKTYHEEYKEYSAYILLRHVLMHDFFHMYRIEELWLIKDEFLNIK